MYYVFTTVARFGEFQKFRVIVSNHYKIRTLDLVGPVAQRLEQRTHNPLVLGSNPSGPTSTKKRNAIGRVNIPFFIFLAEHVPAVGDHIRGLAHFLENLLRALKLFENV
jgi:hypothetical protein